MPIPGSLGQVLGRNGPVAIALSTTRCDCLCQEQHAATAARYLIHIRYRQERPRGRNVLAADSGLNRHLCTVLGLQPSDTVTRRRGPHSSFASYSPDRFLARIISPWLRSARSLWCDCSRAGRPVGTSGEWDRAGSRSRAAGAWQPRASVAAPSGCLSSRQFRTAVGLRLLSCSRASAKPRNCAAAANCRAVAGCPSRRNSRTRHCDSDLVSEPRAQACCTRNAAADLSATHAGLRTRNFARPPAFSRLQYSEDITVDL